MGGSWPWRSTSFALLFCAFEGVPRARLCSLSGPYLSGRISISSCCRNAAVKGSFVLKRWLLACGTKMRVAAKLWTPAPCRSRGSMPGQWSSIRSSRLHVRGCIVPHLGCCVEEVLSDRGWSASSVLVWFSMILVRNPWTLVSQSLHSSQGKSLRTRPCAWLWRSTTCSDWRGRSFSLIALEQPPSPASRPLRCKSVEVIDLHRTEVNLFPNDVRLDLNWILKAVQTSNYWTSWSASKTQFCLFSLCIGNKRYFLWILICPEPTALSLQEQVQTWYKHQYSNFEINKRVRQDTHPAQT